MKKYLMFMALLPTVAFSQKAISGAQLGPLISFIEGTDGYGGEMIGNLGLDNRSSIGAGIQLIKFKDFSAVYLPTFATYRICFPASKVIYYFHFDAGYSVFNNERLYDNLYGTTKVKTNGGFYWGTGLGLHGNSSAAPYLEVSYSLYKFRWDISTANSKLSLCDNTNALVVSVGFWLSNQKSNRKK